ncbi:LacI family transcriptional regulator [Bifidobacterium lemurum]|uniref:LacI family transcriptional regulator n=1 Tax=Bifidobacterium lemurum TaxID=1603886 RepID=A0A261FUV9_9BIFI|nr:sugar ABC transporter substrate-binding protein [Bifidobacterium lemurum]OZG62713.1 LacI family transcriptional regulator [Bifidobacterium lemurum]QOL34570.1 sugar ABC transporter substrate-binding protein [Bifidobacterium lemurum]
MSISKKAVAMFAAVAFAVAGLSGCGTSADTSAEGTTGASDAEIKLGYVPSTMNNPFWQAILDGINEEIDGQSVSVQTVDPQADQSKMNDMVGDLIASGVNAIILGPYDTTGVQPALQAAADAGIPVINIDTPVDDLDLVETVVASDNKKAGALVAEDMMSRLDEGSDIAVINCPSGQACIQRLEGFKEEAGDYFNIVQELDGKGELATSLTLAEDILQSNPDLKAIFGVNDPMALGAVQALAAHPEMSDVLVYGVDGSPDGKAAIKDGTMAGTGAQSPNKIGHEAAKAALDVLDGKEVEKDIVVDTFLVTKDNVDEYGTDGWQ